MQLVIFTVHIAICIDYLLPIFLAAVKVASFFFNDLSGILPSGRVESDDSEDTESVIGSPVISSTLGCGNENCPSLQTPEPVRIVFKKKKIVSNCSVNVPSLICSNTSTSTLIYHLAEWLYRTRLFFL